MKTAKRFLVAIIIVVAVLALVLYADNVQRNFRAFKADSAGYMGLNIGASMDEALYVFGVPQTVVGPYEKYGDSRLRFARLYQVDGKDPKNAIPAGKIINDYSEWAFDRNNDDVSVTFDPKTKLVTKISCAVDLSRWDWECPRIFGISTETHEDEVRDRLGAPSWVKYEHANKSLGYDQLGLVVTLTQQRVFMLEKQAAGRATWQWKLQHLVI